MGAGLLFVETGRSGREGVVFMRDKGRMETEDLILGKAKYEDWRSIYRNVWSRPETAEYMVWKVTVDEDGARERIQRTITWQETHDAWMVYEKASGQAIGFAGVEEAKPHIYHETGIALGPEYVGKGYGKQILCLLMEYCVSLGGRNFIILHGQGILLPGRWPYPVV